MVCHHTLRFNIVHYRTDVLLTLRVSPQPTRRQDQDQYDPRGRPRVHRGTSAKRDTGRDDHGEDEPSTSRHLPMP